MQHLVFRLVFIKKINRIGLLGPGKRGQGIHQMNLTYLLFSGRVTALFTSEGGTILGDSFKVEIF